MAYGKKNVVDLHWYNYNIMLMGLSGWGKTTLVKEMCEKELGDDGYLFAELGHEEGADAIQGINYINCPQMHQEYDEDTNSVGFVDLIEDIIENKEEEYPNLKMLVIDTYDQLLWVAENESIRLYNKDNPDNKAKSIDQAWGGYKRGSDKADDLYIDLLWSLKEVGVHFFLIGHIKSKELTDAETGTTYMQLTSDISARSFDKIKNKLHFLGVGSYDRDYKTRKVKGKNKNFIASEDRKITFRDDNYAIDSKSRFADIVDEIPFGADEFIKAMNDAIIAEAEKSNISAKEQKKIQTEKDKKLDERAKINSKNAKEFKIDEERNEELVEEIKAGILTLKTDEDKAGQVKDLMKELGVKSFKNPEEIPTKYLEQIMDKINDLILEED